MLEARNLRKHYGRVRAIHDVEVSFKPGEITAVVGANGAGKTSLLDCLSGHLNIDAGSVSLQLTDGVRDVTGLAPWQRAAVGILRGFQDSALFPGLTVWQSLLVSQYRESGATLFRSMMPRFRQAHVAKAREVRAAAALADFNLEAVRKVKIENLSLGMTKVLQLACASVASPKWLLLDEPSAGLARREIDNLGMVLRRLLEFNPGLGIVMVEHDASLVAEAADALYLMDTGEVDSYSRQGDDAWFELLGTRTTARGPAENQRAGARTDGTGVTADPSQRSPDTLMEANDGTPALTAQALTIRYGQFTAVDEASLAVRQGEISCLVGTNGAGKSSILNVMAGLLRATDGVVTLHDDRIDGMRAHKRVQLGVALIPSGRGLLAPLTVGENLKLAEGRTRVASGPAIDPFEMFPELSARVAQRAGTLSGGEQQMLALARTLQLRPTFLLIDELSLGLNPRVVTRLIDALHRLRDEGLGILVVEQDGPLALEFSDWAYVIHQGRISFNGPCAEARGRDDLFHPVFLGDRSDVEVRET